MQEGDEGDDNSSFWFDKWLSIGSLHQLVPFVNTNDLNVKVKDVWKDGTWQLAQLWTSVPNEAMQLIQMLSPRLCNGVPDLVTWSHSVSGQYSARSTYNWLSCDSSTYNGAAWTWLWKLPVPAIGDCPRCGVGEETIAHCLRDCHLVKQIWSLLGLANICDNVVLFPWKDWLERGFNRAGFLFLAAVWKIWLSRNSLTFSNERRNHGDIVWESVHQADLFSRVFSHSRPPMASNRPQHLVAWEPPSLEQVTLNKDGSVSHEHVGFGGLIRSDDGSWLRGVPTFHKLATLVMEIRLLLARDWTVSVQHTLREGNQCTDFHAKCGATSSSYLQLLQDPPLGLLPMLQADAQGVKFPI
ncbi:ribonuclease H [Sesbania bispinosa]|nr:ribonuclease H [Sesbania bispinosa]